MVSEHQSLSHQAILQFIAEMSLSDTGCLSAAFLRLMVTSISTIVLSFRWVSIAGLTTFNNTVQTGSGATVGFGTSAFISFGDLTIHQGDAVIGHGLSVAGVSSISTLHVTGDGKIDGVLRGENDTRALQVGTGVSIAGITTLGWWHHNHRWRSFCWW